MESNGANSPVLRKRYPTEMRDRSVRMVLDHRGEYASELEAIKSIAGKMGMHPTTLRDWIRSANGSGDRHRPLADDERERFKQLERENRELRRANAILKSASVFFATELDGRQPR
jgi:transposase